MAQRIQERLCGEHLFNGSHARLFPAPGLEPARDWTERVGFLDSHTGRILGVSAGALWVYQTDDVLGAYDTATGRLREVLDPPPGSTHEIRVGAGVMLANTRNGVARRADGEPWTVVDSDGDTAEDVLIGPRASWWRSNEGLMRLPHDRDTAIRVDPPLDVPASERRAWGLVVIAGEVWATGRAGDVRTRRWTDDGWVTEDAPHGAWMAGHRVAMHDDGWAVVVHNGDLYVIASDGRVSTSGVDCGSSGVYRRVLSDGQHVIALSDDAWFRVRAP